MPIKSHFSHQYFPYGLVVIWALGTKNKIMTPHVAKPPDNCNHNTARMSDEWMTWWEKVILFSHINSRVYNWGNWKKKFLYFKIWLNFYLQDKFFPMNFTNNKNMTLLKSLFYRLILYLKAINKFLLFIKKKVRV